MWNRFLKIPFPSKLFSCFCLIYINTLHINLCNWHKFKKHLLIFLCIFYRKPCNHLDIPPQPPLCPLPLPIPQSLPSPIPDNPLLAIREASFRVHAPKLFNSLPQSIRNLSKISVEDFKIKLDNYLELVPDEPKIGGYYPSACNQFSGNPSNSIIDQGRHLRARRPGF